MFRIISSFFSKKFIENEFFKRWEIPQKIKKWGFIEKLQIQDPPKYLRKMLSVKKWQGLHQDVGQRARLESAKSTFYAIYEKVAKYFEPC